MQSQNFSVRSLFIINMFVSLLALPVWAEETATPPKPPAVLNDWLEYALKRFPPDDCPTLPSGAAACAAVTSVGLSGDLSTGKITLDVVARNWGRKSLPLDLIGPASAFVLEDPQIIMTSLADEPLEAAGNVAPFFDASGGSWKIIIPPGKFLMKAQLAFSVAPVIPLTLPADVGRIRQNLTGGSIRFDPNLGSHGGEARFVLDKDGSSPKEDATPQIRVMRVFTWGVIPTFEYKVTAHGLRGETAVQMPLLADEVVESVSPEKPYVIQATPAGRVLETNLSPAGNELTINGHYQNKPEQFKMPEGEPFEIWFQVSDNRYPVNIETDARPVDPAEFPNVEASDRSKAFLVKPGQILRFLPVALTVDEGRKASGRGTYVLREGAIGQWAERLSLTAKISQDRLVIPTPTPPVYAGISGDGIELHRDAKGALSVRLPPDGLQDRPLDVDWAVNRSPVWLADLVKFELPGQALFLDERTVTAQFRPGVVPILAWGGEAVKGDLRDEFHLYGLLIGVFAFFLMRGLKLSFPLALVMAGLMAGLYLERLFPTSFMLALMVATLPFVRLGDETIESLVKRRFLRRLVLLVWSGLFLCAVVQLGDYGRSRIYAALHPYADAKASLADGRRQSYYGSESEDYVSNMGSGLSNSAPMSKGDVMRKMAKPKMEQQALEPLQNQNIDYDQKDQVDQAKAWNAKPVALTAAARVGCDVRLTNYHVADNKPASVRVLVAGPILRGAWLIGEVLVVFLVVALLLRRSLRLWRVAPDAGFMTGVNP